MADNKKYYYLKLKENFFESDEAIILESMPDGYIYSNILLKLYLRSLKNDGLLMFNNLIPYNAQMLATITRHQVGTIEKAIQIFRDLQLIEILDNGAIYMTNIQNFVGKSSTDADRKRIGRSKVKQIGQMSAKCTEKSPPEIEIETEKELEIKLDKEIKLDIKSEVEEEIKDSSSAADEKSDFNIFEYYQSRIGILDGYQAEKLNAYLQIDKLESKLVKRAIDRAADNSKRSFGYINSILKSWAQNGITTITQQDEEQRQFQSRKSKQEEVSEYDTW
ncbi:TPA: phage replisome organizer N-terminal domain-containing protein [Streptococcus equi subsp. zooepidemicus]|uniref:phage replisome organizer N-terminal domain-containing protein n=1 Tax=Streptococcus equi TaxID=1336 RepID=UPI001E471FA3|nr:phage replisome organizer N-terminal domain-containing protein [Streptococcus equi]MCD3452840.1 phage replisome organizer N-terminal domain-containing protein [Streptococcus equi subsp. zooepidemicus]HEL1357034.1 phage replisome organizer N-terminal domain-containing protein [Streptococcus equi subsp. zooepidemicus]